MLCILFFTVTNIPLNHWIQRNPMTFTSIPFIIYIVPFIIFYNKYPIKSSHWVPLNPMTFRENPQVADLFVRTAGCPVGQRLPRVCEDGPWAENQLRWSRWLIPEKWRIVSSIIDITICTHVVTYIYIYCNCNIIYIYIYCNICT